MKPCVSTKKKGRHFFYGSLPESSTSIEVSSTEAPRGCQRLPDVSRIRDTTKLYSGFTAIMDSITTATPRYHRPAIRRRRPRRIAIDPAFDHGGVAALPSTLDSTTAALPRCHHPSIRPSRRRRIAIDPAFDHGGVAALPSTLVSTTAASPRCHHLSIRPLTASI